MLNNDNDAARRMVENCYRKHITVLNPIIDWTDADVWGYIKSEKIPMCGLYECGWRRLGCIGCPMATRRNRLREFAHWPKYKDAYLRAFAKMLRGREKKNKPWRAADVIYPNATPKMVFDWWLEDKNIDGQQAMEGFEDYDY